MAAGKIGKLVRIAGGLLVLLGLSHGMARADEDPALFKLAAGPIGLVPSDRNKAGYFSFEYRGGPSWDFWHIRPSIGLGATTDSSIYGWTGLNLDIFFGPRIVLTPTVGVGLYRKGDGQNLGSVVEFRNGAELAWRFQSHSRIGIGLHYLSNLGIGDDDPGTTTLTVFYAHPLGSILPP